MPIRVVLVDSHPMMRHGLANFLGRQPQIRVIAEATGCTDACDIITTMRPDLVLFDLSLDDAKGPEILRRFRDRFTGLRALVYTDDSRPETVTAALDADVQGYVLKASPLQRLCDAVNAITAGKSYIDPALAETALQYTKSSVDGGSSIPPLTSRQAAILHMVSHGMANKEIARQLEISERTVKFHLSLIFRRLQVRNRLQAVNAATRSHGLRNPQPRLN